MQTFLFLETFQFLNRSLIHGIFFHALQTQGWGPLSHRPGHRAHRTTTECPPLFSRCRRCSPGPLATRDCDRADDMITPRFGLKEIEQWMSWEPHCGYLLNHLQNKSWTIQFWRKIFLANIFIIWPLNSTSRSVSEFLIRLRSVHWDTAHTTGVRFVRRRCPFAPSRSPASRSGTSSSAATASPSTPWSAPPGCLHKGVAYKWDGLPFVDLNMPPRSPPPNNGPRLEHSLIRTKHSNIKLDRCRAFGFAAGSPQRCGRPWNWGTDSLEGWPPLEGGGGREDGWSILTDRSPMSAALG